MVSLVGTRSGRTGHNFLILFHILPLTWPLLNIFSLSDPSLESTMGFGTNLYKGCPISTQFRPDFDRFREGKRLVLRSLTYVNGHGWRGKRKRLFQAWEERQVDHHDHYPSMQAADIIFGHTYKTSLNDARGKARRVRHLWILLSTFVHKTINQRNLAEKKVEEVQRDDHSWQIKAKKGQRDDNSWQGNYSWPEKRRDSQ